MEEQQTLLELIAAYGKAKYNHGASLHAGGTVRVISDYMIESDVLLAAIERRIRNVRNSSVTAEGRALIGDILDGKE